MNHYQDWIDETLRWIASPDEKERQSAILRNEPVGEIEQFRPPTELEWPLHLLIHLPDFLSSYFDESRDIELASKRIDHVVDNLSLWNQQYLQKLRQSRTSSAEEIAAVSHEMVAGWQRLYTAIQPFHAFRSEESVLRTLLTTPGPDAIRVWRDLVTMLPPTHHRTTAASIETLIRRSDWKSYDIFPQLLDGLEHPTTIASVLDLANWVMRNEPGILHPAQTLSDRLNSLLVSVVQRLQKLETNPTAFGSDVRTIQRILDESVALCIALCDTLGLIQNPSSIAALKMASSLRHRRIECEAAAALARFDDPNGKSLLIKLAAEPITRQRVLTYAEELDLIDHIEDAWKSEYAKAESQLATWLAAPNNFGLAPKQLELIDQRNLMWPSYTEPQTCYLFRFTYPLANGQYTNVGIAGPLVHAFNADMAELPELDIYAAFAGWQAEHPEIFEVARSEFNSSQLNVADQLIDALRKDDYSDVQTSFLGSFMGESVLVATAKHGEAEGVVVFDGSDVLWYPATGRARPVGPHEAYAIYKGRRFLRAFNPEL